MKRLLLGHPIDRLVLSRNFHIVTTKCLASQSRRRVRHEYHGFRYNRHWFKSETEVSRL